MPCLSTSLVLREQGPHSQVRGRAAAGQAWRWGAGPVGWGRAGLCAHDALDIALDTTASSWRCAGHLVELTAISAATQRRCRPCSRELHNLVQTENSTKHGAAASCACRLPSCKANSSSAGPTHLAHTREVVVLLLVILVMFVTISHARSETYTCKASSIRSVFRLAKIGRSLASPRRGS